MVTEQSEGVRRSHVFGRNRGVESFGAGMGRYAQGLFRSYIACLWVPVALGAGQAGCASYRVKIHPPGCPVWVQSPTNCDARSYKVEYPDRVEFYCVKDIVLPYGRIATKTQVYTYRCHRKER